MAGYREPWLTFDEGHAEILKGDRRKAALQRAATTMGRTTGGGGAQANGVSARDLQAQVHHSDPLEWAHLKPGADPNRLASLWAFGLDITPGIEIPAVYFFDKCDLYEKPSYAAGSSLGAFLLLLADHDLSYREGWPEKWELKIDPDIDACPRARAIWAAG